MQKKFLFRIGLFLLIIIGFIWWFLYELTWEGDRVVGILSHPCNKVYSIKVNQYSQFDCGQPLYFIILKNNIPLKDYYGQFEISNNTRESINSFDIHCYDSILFVTWKDGNIPIIMFDTKSHKLFPFKYEKGNYDDDKYKKVLFERIRKGYSKLEIE